MKYIKLFENFNSAVEDMLNNILDKINKSGINSLTTKEKDFLDSPSVDKLPRSDKPSLYKIFDTDDTNSLYHDRFIDIEVDCSLPKLRRYNIKFVSSNIENTEDGNILIYGELILTPKGEDDEIYLKGYIELDSNGDYYGYQFNYDEDGEGEEDSTYFDNMIEDDNILNNYIEEFFKEAILFIKTKLVDDENE